MEWTGYEAVLFDLDGVLTPTAQVHMRAWESMFNDYLAQHAPQAPRYSADDYFQYVDGKPRYEGVRSFLSSRGLSLPDGTPDDRPDQLTVAGLGNRKNDVFAQVLHDEGVQAYPGSVALLDYLATTGVAMAIVSSSRNARPVLEAAGLLERFPVIVDGVVAAAEHLRGKPEPQTFEYAAQLLGYPSSGCVVVEDAVSGVQAGKAGDFALVIGVDRGAGHDVLRAAGADVVVSDLQELVP